MPPKESIINEDFELPNEQETAVEIELPPESDEIEVEVIDDTPEEDRGRQPLPSDEDPEHEQELNGLAKDTKKRINQLTHRYHDERREKERLAREHAEAIRIAQLFKGRVDELEQTLNWGHQEWSKEGQGRIETGLKLAQDKYRRAFEAGDTDGVLEAQQEMLELFNQKARYENTQIPVAPVTIPQDPLQTTQQPVYNTQNAPKEQAAPRDYRAEDWAARNKWFGKDAKMTAYAYGVHEDLVQNQGYDPTSDEYYQAIDAEIKQRFPEKFPRPKGTSPVAPVARSTAPKKFTLTASEAAIAKRLGLTQEQYAREKMKGATING